MLQPFNPTLAMGLVVDTAKTTCIGYILFQLDPLPPACELIDQPTAVAGPMNSLQGVWLVGAKGSWADLSPFESEVLGYWHASRRYHIRGTSVIYGFVDHQPFAEYYSKKQMSALSPRMFKLMQELEEYPFVMGYMPGSGSLIGMVDALSRAPYDYASTLGSDPLHLQYTSINRDQAQTNHESCFATPPLGSEGPGLYDPSLRFLYEAALEDGEHMEILDNVVAGHEWLAYKNKPLHPVGQWGRALFESLSIICNRQGRPLLFKGGVQALVPKACVPEILEVVDAVHYRADRACMLAQRRYYWDRLKGDVRKHCKDCVTCKIM